MCPVKAIEFKPNVKFITNEYLYYRGLAYKHLGNYEAAILDYTFRRSVNFILPL